MDMEGLIMIVIWLVLYSSCQCLLQTECFFLLFVLLIQGRGLLLLSCSDIDHFPCYATGN